MFKKLLILLWCITAFGIAQAQTPASPFGAQATLLTGPDALEVQVELTGPAGGHFNAGLLRLNVPEGYTAEAINPPTPEPDELFNAGVYSPGTVLRYRITPAQPMPDLTIRIQGCVDEMCYMPQVVPLALLTPAQADTSETVATEPDAMPWFQRFSRWSSSLGYTESNDFAKWLDQAVNGDSEPQGNLLTRVAARYGLWLAALLIIPLGLLLNLTPCVLPMIPITLAVLGTGSAGTGRRRGVWLGATYGGAMALAYGLIGALFVKVGGRFGAINANPWFNFGVAIVFICLALSMFDVFILDLTRFRGTEPHTRGTFGTAALLGAMAALLAGACVAPVLIWVLLFSTELYSGGNALGLWLPLLLGIGLGLPWPFLGAGLGFLPKPGAWMLRVKQGFGILILLFACYYLWSGARLMQKTTTTAEDQGYWMTDINEAVTQAQRLQKPLFIDIWGVTCKACNTMDATTLQNQEVRQRLDQMVRLKIQADDFDDPALAPALQYFKVPGLPAYIVLLP